MKKQIVRTTVTETVFDDEGNAIGERTDTFDTVHIFAENGMVFCEKATGDILTNHLSIGTEDDENNYEEIAVG